MNEIHENVTNAVENAVTHCVGATDVAETAVSSAKNLTIGGIGIGVAASAAIGGIIYGGIKLYKLISKKIKEHKNNVVEINDGKIIDGECDEIK